MFDLDYNDNGTSHRDVTLRFGDVEKLCDSYYFASTTTYYLTTNPLRRFAR